MPTLVCVTFRNVNALPPLEDHVFDLAQRLGAFCDSIAGCRVEVAGPSSGTQAGEPCSAEFVLSVLEQEVVGSGRGATATAALQDAFAATAAQLGRLSHDRCRCARRRNDAEVGDDPAARPHDPPSPLRRPDAGAA